MKIHTKLMILATLMSLSVTSQANETKHYYAQKYKVTITNLTKGISFTPLLVATHNKRTKLFTLGEAASNEVSRIAEGGDISGLNEQLSQSRHVYATANTAGLLAPGESVTVEINSNRRKRKISIIAMLLPTNDTLVALQSLYLPYYGQVTYLMNAYDGGSETNDELCNNIPGPRCGGTPFSPEDNGEGYVYPSSGIHGQGDLSTIAYQWQGPVAKVVIERMYW